MRTEAEDPTPPQPGARRPTRALYFNGKFYAAGINGVHRVADRLIREVDRLLGETPPPERPPGAFLLLPERRRWAPQLKHIQLVYEPRGHSQVWEQLILPRRARDGLLVNLCNLSPLLHRHKVLLLHDAQFLFPDNSYPARLRWGYRLLTPWMARTSTRVLAVSEYSRQVLDLCGIADRRRCSVLYNGADHLLEVAATAGFAAAMGLARGSYAVHFASAKAYKNSAVVFRAFADERLAETRLVLVGAEPAELARAGLSPPPNAIFAGKIDDAALRDLYENALCLLYPSRTEGFGLPPVEAMNCGCPAVVSPAGAIPEICRDAVLYADVDDAEGWASAIARYRDDPTLRALKVEAGLARARDFTWAKAGRALLDVLLGAAQW
jgi:glycosyltransferase involved in cell wall biosynthesis